MNHNKNDYSMLTQKKSKTKWHSTAISTPEQTLSPVLQNITPSMCTEIETQSPCSVHGRNRARLPKRGENVTRPEHKGWDGILLLAQWIMHQEKMCLAIPGPDSNTESLGEHWCCAQCQRGASPSFPKTMDFGVTSDPALGAFTGLQGMAEPKPCSSQCPQLMN